MQKVIIKAVIQDRLPQDVFKTVSAFERYPELVDTVKDVRVHDGATGTETVSDWQVYFRNGILSWTERDVFDHEALTIVFDQEEGDFDVFRGTWAMSACDEGTSLSFDAEFDFGVPSLASIIDPVAVRVLTEAMETILLGLFDGRASFRHASSLDRSGTLAVSGS
ncbi:SRPBCC family protein [Streptomyces sp. NPDC089799]|uniref:type II toxin-antitoxin system RatA family toxin n=1 Tax=Streptomyces sp. NPDC089799 TaxID=3155066 RepID=UPI00343E2975